MPYVELGPSELVDQALLLGKRHFLALLLAGIIPVLVAWELGHLARISGVYSTLRGWVYLLGAYAATALGDAAMIFAAWQLLHAQPATLRAIWARVGAHALSVVIGYTWKALLVGFGIVLLIAPGLYVATSYFVVPGIFPIEGVGLRAGMAHSRALASSPMRIVFLSYTLFWMVTAAVTFLIPVELRQLHAPTVAFRVIPLLWYVIVAPFRSALIARVYADRRAAKEGYDLGLELAGLTAPA